MLVGGNYEVNPQAGMQDISSEGGESTGAAASDAIAHLPTTSAFELFSSLNVGGYDEGARFDQDTINKKKDTEFYAQYIDIGNNLITELEYNKLYRATRARKLRESVLSRAPDTFTQQAKQFAVGLGVGILDPLNVAIGLMPLGLAAKGAFGLRAKEFTKGYAASLVDKSVLGRAGARAGMGGATGLVESAITEVPIYFAANLRGEDYTADDVFTSIMFGAVVGSGIHVGGGALYDVATLKSARKRKAQAVKDEIIAKEKRTVSPDAQLDNLLITGIVNSDDFSPNQRFLAELPQADRASLAQGNIASFLDGNRIDAKPMLDMLDAKRLGEKYRPEDVEQMYFDVAEEQLQRAMDERAVIRVSPLDKKAFGDSINKARNEINTLIKETPVITKGASKAKRADHQKHLQKIERKQADLESLRENFKARKGRDKVLQERIKSMRKGETPDELRNNINTRVAQIVEIVDATYAPKSQPQLNAQPNKLSNAVKSGLEAMRTRTESNTSARTYRPDVEEKMQTRGARQGEQENITALAQQAVDAEVNAKNIAERNGLTYEPSMGIEQMSKQINANKLALESLSACMVKSV